MVSQPAIPLDISQRSLPAVFGQTQPQPNPFMIRGMELAAAQEAFMSMVQQIQQPDTRRAFLQWIDNTFIRPGGGGGTNGMICNNGAANGVSGATNTAPNGGGSGASNGGGSMATDHVADTRLRRIADDIREIMPFTGILPSEHITFPSIGENSDCDPTHTIHVDAFLYDEDLVDELCDTGELGRNYCLDCSSHNTQPLTYISHSASRERLAYLFRALLPPVPEDAVILDVGSRLGAVLYGAYMYTKSRRLVGIELNEEFCVLQQRIINKYNFQDRMTIVAGDVQQHANIVNSADVVILNNVFEFFMPPQLLSRVWAYMRNTIKRGALIVTIPSLTESTQHLELNFSIQEWVREVPPHDPNVTAPFDFQTETSEVKLYQVL